MLGVYVMGVIFVGVMSWVLAATLEEFGWDL